MCGRSVICSTKDVGTLSVGIPVNTLEDFEITVSPRTIAYNNKNKTNKDIDLEIERIKNILVVEDNNVNAFIYKKKIMSMCKTCNVIIAEDGVIGKQKYLDNLHELDGLFVDYRIPNMTGDTLTQEIRNTRA